jgi:hypothetical protein
MCARTGRFHAFFSLSSAQPKTTDNIVARQAAGSCVEGLRSTSTLPLQPRPSPEDAS